MRRTPQTFLTRTSIAAILTLLIGWPSVAAREWGDLSGTWDGIIKVSGSDLGIEVRFVPGEKIEWTGEVDIAVQGAKNIPLGNIMLDGNRLTFMMTRAHGDPVFEGELSESGMSVVGTFIQGESVFDFSMTARDDSLVSVERTTLHERLMMIREFIDTARVTWDVPGLSIAILSDGFAVLSVGTGSRNLAEDLPATRTTMYPIGSATETFTATGLASLVADGRLAWDEPVRSYLPELVLADEIASRSMTTRDLLSHRTGLAPHETLSRIYRGTRADLVAKLQFLESNAEFRTIVQPQELMYTLGGYLTERLKSQKWEEVIRRYLLGPLRLGRTGFSVDTMLADYDYATAYRTGTDDLEPAEVRRAETLGPACGMYSTAVDLSRWLEFWLRRGTTGQAARVMSGYLLDEMITPQAVLRPATQYPERLNPAAAIGWSVEAYRGHRRVFSDGFIDGYSSNLAFFPDDDLGVVVLCNKDQSPLPEIVSLYVADLFLNLDPVDFHGRYLRAAAAGSSIRAGHNFERQPRHDDTKPSHKAAEYAGVFEHGIYGQIVITAEGKKLVADLNGYVSELRHWHYDTYQAEFSGVPGSYDLTFNSDDRGDIISIAVPFEPSVAPIIFHRQPPPDLVNTRLMDMLAGDYDWFGRIVHFERRNQDLYCIFPGQQEHRLVPETSTEFRLEGVHQKIFEFVLGDQGEVLHLLIKDNVGVTESQRIPEVAPN